MNIYGLKIKEIIPPINLHVLKMTFLLSASCFKLITRDEKTLSGFVVEVDPRALLAKMSKKINAVSHLVFLQAQKCLIQEINTSS